MSKSDYIGKKVRLTRDIATQGGTKFRKGVVMTVSDRTSSGLSLYCYKRGHCMSIRNVAIYEVEILREQVPVPADEVVVETNPFPEQLKHLEAVPGKPEEKSPLVHIREPGTEGPVKPLTPENEKLTEGERKVLGAFKKAKGSLTIDQMAATAFPNEAKSKSWVRNGLRKLVRLGLVEQIGRGLYALALKEEGANADHSH